MRWFENHQPSKPSIQLINPKIGGNIFLSWYSIGFNRCQHALFSSTHRVCGLVVPNTDWAPRTMQSGVGPRCCLCAPVLVNISFQGRNPLGECNSPVNHNHISFIEYVILPQNRGRSGFMCVMFSPTILYVGCGVLYIDGHSKDRSPQTSRLFLFEMK